MAKSTWNGLDRFIPEGSSVVLYPLLDEYPLQLKIVNGRRSKLGDYRFPTPQSDRHRITVNGDLDPHQFLITLLHELAHMQAFHKHGRKIKPHGDEWKRCYKQLLIPFENYFPGDKHKLIRSHIEKPTATTNLEDIEMLNRKKLTDGAAVVKELVPGTVFRTERGQEMEMIKKLRTHYLCRDKKNDKMYRVHAMLVVQPINNN